MITLQSLMLVALGALGAALAVIMIAPAYHRRVVRLTTEAIRKSIPITEAEIRADKDRIRAQFAIRVHKLESQCEQQQLAAARQLVEMNRKDARITELNTEIEAMRASLEEHVNARRVLEHTVTDRLPRLEQQLESAREHISARDLEMSSLKSETARSVRALDEALQLNAQQRGEMERIGGGARRQLPRESGADLAPASDSEIEALRAKVREQQDLISSLQSTAAGTSAGGGDELRARLDDQAAEIARLTAALAAYEGDKDGGRANVIRDSRIGARAKINSLQAQIATQNDTIQKLRAELAAFNERLARQAAAHADEMRRLGTGIMPASIEPRRGREAQAQRPLADRLGAPERGLDGKGATSSKVADYLRALTDDAPETDAHAALEDGDRVAVVAAAAGDDVGDRRGRLMDRISGLKKS